MTTCRFTINHNGFRASGQYNAKLLRRLTERFERMCPEERARYWLSAMYTVPVTNFKITGHWPLDDDFVEVSYLNHTGLIRDTDSWRACFIPMYSGERNHEGEREVHLSLVVYSRTLENWIIIFDRSLVVSKSMRTTGIAFKITPSK